MTYEQSGVVHDWSDNGRFLVVRSMISGKLKKFTAQDLMTPELWDKTHKFTPNEHVKQKAQRTYRTYGLYFHSGSIVYARTLENLKSGLSRMFQARPQEFKLQQNQQNFCKAGRRRHRACITKMQQIIHTQFATDLPTDEISSTISFSQTPHAKKLLRQQACKQLLDTSTFTKPVYADEVKAKVKIETAKAGKNARIYVDMTTPQSLLGGWLIDSMKQAMEVVDLGWCVFKFVGHTDEASVKEAFEFLRDNAHRPCIVYHSDDAIVSLPCRDGPLRFNLDISSCDRSNTKAIFELLCLFVPPVYREYFKRIALGARLSLRVPNPETKGEYVKVSPLQPFEYSGINITTLLNNVASLMIGLSIFYKHELNMSKEEVLASIPDRVRTAGYIVTTQICDVFEQLQFLKFSPSDELNCYPVRNLGCILRALGHIDGDFAGRGSLEKRAAEHISSVVSGITSGYVDPISYKLRKKWVNRGIKPKQVKYQYSLVDWTFDVGYQHLHRRYGLSGFELAYLEELVLSAGVGDIVSSRVLSKIFELDYSATAFDDYPIYGK